MTSSNIPGAARADNRILRPSERAYDTVWHDVYAVVDDSGTVVAVTEDQEHAHAIAAGVIAGTTGRMAHVRPTRMVEVVECEPAF